MAKTHRDVGRGKARHRKSRRPDQQQATFPTFKIEPQRFVMQPAPFTFTRGSSKYVGRVGALAIALGVGVMVTTGQGLGVASAETGADSADAATTDGAPESGAPESTETAPSTGPSDEPNPARPPDDGAPSTPSQATAPEMQLDSSGGADTSTNDAGQLTDDESAPGASTPEDDAAAITDSDPDPAAAEDSVAHEDSAPTEPTPSDTPLTPDSGESEQESDLVAIDESPVVADSDEDPQARLSLMSTDDLATEGDQQAFTAFTALSSHSEQASTFSAFDTFHHVAPEPLEMIGVIIPRGLVTIATTMVGLMLSPFLAPGPIDPVQPPLLWMVLGFVRREINRTFFNLSPVICAQDITLTLGPGEVSEPIEFNAHDGDDDPLTYRVPERGRAGGPEHGTVTVDQATGTFTYNPDDGYTGPDQFTVAVSDHTSCLHIHGLLSLFGWHSAHTDRAKIKLNVVAPNGVPLANPDGVSTEEDTPLTGDVLTNDTNAGDDPLTASLVSGPGHGILALDPDGSFSYAPEADWSGVDSFTYTASNGTATSNAATVTVAVAPVNDAPVAEDDAYSVAEDDTLTVPTDGVVENLGAVQSVAADSYTVPEDTALTVPAATGVLADDTDPDNDSLTAELVSDPAHGTLDLNANGSFSYTPDPNFTGADSFTYTAFDGELYSAPATVTITVTAVNDAPVAANNSYTAAEDGTLNVTGPGVLTGDTDIENNSLTAVLVSGPSHGDLTLNANGSFSYTPDANFTGNDSFTYAAFDGALNSAPATVTITVSAVNDAPVAANNSYTVAEDGTLNVTAPGVLTGDTDVENSPLTAVLITNPSHGTLNLNGNGSFSYTPDANFTGNDSFTYKAFDGALNSAPATVSITVTAANDAPVANDDAYSVAEDGTLNVTSPGVLTGDTDTENDSLTAVLVSSPTHGTLNLNANGSFSYTPDANFTGNDSFTYKAFDGTSNSAPATVTITVTAVNDAPVAANNSYTVTEDGTLNVTGPGVLAGDADTENDSLTAVLVSSPTHGDLTLNADGSFSYTPDANFTGNDSFTYAAFDGALNSAPATVTISVTTVNDAPVADADSYTVAEDGTLNVTAPGVLAGDTDTENDSLTAVLVSNPSHGNLTLNANGSFGYTPDANFTGNDSFTYQAFDGALNSAPATVTITVTAVNDAPVAANNTYTVAEDGTLSVTAPGVLTGDSDVENNPLTAVLVSGPAHGDLTLNTDGSFTYTPDADFTGTDSFAYAAFDGSLNSAPATVTITASAANDAPVADADSYTVAEDGTLNVAAPGVLIGDTDVENNSLTAVLVSGPAHGDFTLNADGSFNYTPNADFNGDDSFTYTAFDGALNSAPATVTITVSAANDAPVADADSYTVAEDGTLNIAAPGVLVGDTDTENDALTAVLVSGPAHGDLTPNADGSFTYTPDANYTGDDSFTYTAFDGDLNSAPATVTITVTAVNDAPVADADSYTVAEDGTLNIAAPGVLVGDTDTENDALTAVLVSGPAHGDLTPNSDGSFTYTPDANYTGDDSFTYTAFDGDLNSAPATVTITVTAVNDAPVADADSYTVAEDGVLNVAAPGVLIGDTDTENDSLTAVLVSGPAHGDLALNADGSFTYTPDADFTGDDSFTYKAFDGDLNSAPATVTITVSAVNDAPVADADSYTVAEDGTLNVAAPGVLVGDTDTENDALTAVLVSGPAHGDLTLNADGSFTYTPDANYTGDDSFTYTAFDGDLNSAPATVTITVSAVNDAPVADADAYTVAEDGTLNAAAPGVLAGDTDTENDALTAVLVSGPAHGDLTLNADGSFSYTPDADYTGDDSFTYKAFDGDLNSTPATVTISVTAVNDAPVADADSYTVAEDGTLNVAAPGVLVGDTDTENDALTAVLVSGPAHGDLTLNADGSFSYTPDADYAGPDSFTYKAFDGDLNSTPATVTITVTAVNDTPVADADSYTVAEDGTLNVAAPGVLVGDTDTENDALTAVLVSGPAHGDLTLNADGSFTYTPDADFNGDDSFTYKAFDGDLNSTPATVTISVSAVNDAPVADADSYTVAEDGTLNVAAPGVLDGDTDTENDALTAILVSGPAHGDLTLNADGSFTYTPDANYNGEDGFTYKAFDGDLNSTPATVTISVTAVNDAPVADADSYTVAEDGTLNVAAPGVLIGDTDVENDSLTAVLVSGPAHGDLTLNADGSFTYTPDADFTGDDSFTYTAFDGDLNSTPATVTITVTAVNDTPVADADSYTVAEDGTLNVAAPGVLDGDTDTENDALTAVLVSGPAHGDLTLNADGSFTYTPDADFNGDDSFTYKAFDGDLNSTPATVTISVSAVNDAPVADADSYTVAEDGTLNIAAPGVLIGDTDVENDSLTAVLVSGPAHGDLTLNADGSFTYTPDADYTGDDSFTYKAFDGDLNSTPATVTITVTAVNDAPVADADSYTVAEDGTLNVAAPGVLVGDTDTENDALTAVLVSGPAHGDLTLNADGSFTYTPDADFNGDDSFTYKAFDGDLNSTPATVTITVSAVNDAPVADGDSYTVAEDGTLNVAAPGVLDGDTDTENDSLTAVLVSGPAHGDLTLNADGSFSYTPDADFNGNDSFTYTAFDGALNSTPATVTISVSAVNDAPVADGDSYTVAEDGTLNVAAPGVLVGDTDTENDSLTAVLVSGPAHGDLTLNADGSFTYTPDADFTGDDSFTYKAFDGDLNSTPATVTIAVSAVNDAPVADADSYTVAEDGTLNVAAPGVLIGDTDVENDSLTAVLVSGPAHGDLTLNADGSFTYTPDADFTGDDSFTYQAFDGDLNSTPATVTIAVSAVNDAPVADGDSYTVAEDGTLNVAAPGVLDGDTDTENDSLTAVLVSGPAHGDLTLNADGSFTYSPDSDYTGDDSFTYTAFDGDLNSTPATVTISVTAVNDAPVADADSYAVAEDGTLNVAAPGVLVGDTDTENDSLTAVLVSGPAHGDLTLNADGSFTYTPDADYEGQDSFTYAAFDGDVNSTPATVTISVTAVNDAPVADADSYTVAEDGTLNIAAPGVLVGDTDVENNPLTAVLVSGPAHGDLTLNADGSFTYTPDADFNGDDSFTYKAFDGDLNSTPATVTITVTAVNDAPVADADSYTVAEDGTLNVAAPGVLVGDTDTENDALTAVLVSGPAHGDLTLNADGSFTYTPDADYAGDDSFTYTAFDGDLNSTPATVTITVTAVNDAPVADADSHTVAEDSTLNVAAPGVLIGDTDVENNPLTAVLVSGPAHGDLTLNADGSFTYTPDANYNGDDSFTYTAFDGDLNSVPATVTISVTAVNDAPVADADSYTVAEDGTLNVAAPGVLIGDTDVENDSLTAVLVSGPAHGDLTLNADGSFTYTPDANYNGDDSFTYTAFDGDLNSVPATVTISVTAVNDAPVADADSYTVAEDGTLNVAAPGVLIGDTDTENDALTAVLVSGPAHGDLTLNADGSFTYTPDADFNGDDSFTYTAFDGALNATPATVTITVTAVNDAPVADADSYTVAEDGTLNVAAPGVLIGDTDVENDSLTAVLVSGPAHGDLTLNADGSFTYTPDADYAGDDSFTYTAFDGDLNSTPATVTITVTAVNDAPVADADSYTVAEDSTLNVAAPGVLIGDTDVENNPLTAVLVSGPAHGDLTLNADGSFTYTPDANYNGDDSFTYTAFDGDLNSVPATVTISVTAVNDAPVADADSYTVAEDGTLNVAAPGVLIGDNDVENDSLTAVLVSGPAHGDLTLNADGSFTYSPDADYEGQDSFTYKAFDGDLNSTPATVTISVTAVNDAPVADADSYTVAEDGTLNVAAPGVLIGDTDTENDALTAVLVSGPAHGDLTLNGDGSFTYTPDADFNGDDSFTYKAFDGDLNSTPATVTITVTAVNDAPAADADAYTVAEDGTLNIAAPGVLIGDTDVENNPLTAVLVSGPAHGDLTLNADGSFTYTPDADYTGDDSFTYTAFDGDLNSTPATVTITVTAVNDAPVADADSYTVAEDGTLNVAAPGVLNGDTDTENDALTAVLVSGPAHGDLTLNADGSFTYTPDANYNGDDSFTYKAFDGDLNSTPATVTITVTAVNDAPAADADSYTVAEDGTLNVAAPGVLDGDTDTENNSITAVLVSGPAHGDLTLNADGSFTYTPDADYAGPDSFTYTAFDGALNSAPATVTISVTAVNDAPVADADSYTVAEDATLNVAAPGMLDGDTDTENNSLTAVLVSGPAHGDLTLNADGSFSYTPDADYAGPDSFTYTAFDGALNSAPATVTISVTAVNDAPVADADSYTVAEDGVLNVAAPGVLDGDTDTENSPLTSVLVSGPAHGDLTLNADGSFSYTPDADYAGPDSFTYTAFDGALNSAPATVTISVTAVNDAPVADADSYTVAEDGVLNVAAPGVLDGDTDTENSPLTSVLVSGPAHGDLTLNADGSFTYTPDANFNGNDSFTYTAFDGALNSAPATVTITVTAVNDAPVADADSYTVAEDGTLNAAAPGVLDGDTDTENDALTAVLVSGPAHGSLTLNANGSFTYTPDANYNGTDTFTYTASDGNLNSTPATVTITVTAVNDAPVATNNSYTVAEDGTLNVAAPGVLTGDTDVENSPLTAVLVTNPSHGSLTLNANGSFSYTPDANYNGADSFTYTAFDGALNSPPATVTITVTAVNDAPIATNDSYTVAEDGTLNVTTPGVLTNDTDVENSPLAATLVTNASHGSVTLNSNGSFTYTPDANYNGTDTFTYRASDGARNSAPATVTITVTAVNDAPVAANDSYTTNEDTPLTITTPGVLTNDTDIENSPLTAAVVTNPTHGSITLNANGSFTYSPDANYNGADSFTYRASDGTDTSNLATVTIGVTAINDAPVGANDTYTVAEDGTLNVPAAGVLTNDTDVENSPLTATLVDNPAHGSVSLNANGSFTYTPTANYNGTDTFTYRASDGTTTGNLATVTITVTAVNDAPVAANDTYTTNEDTPLTITTPGVLTNDTDTENSPLTAVLVTGPSNGSLTLNPNGSFTYTPNANYSGADSFTYRASDGTTTGNLATVSIGVTAINDAPVATNDTYTTNEDTPLTITTPGVLTNDTDIENSPLTATLIDNPTHGSLTLNPNGSFTYTPDANYNGTDAFTYRASDGALNSGLATVTITVTAVNDAPVAANDTYTTNEDTPLTITIPGVLTNDTDVENSPLTATLVDNPTHGSLTLNADGSFTYTPTANFNGADSFTYRAFDGTTTGNLATVSIGVTPINDPPVATNDTYTVAEDGTLNVPAAGVLTNDTDVENSSLTAALVTGPSNGNLTLNADGSFTYTPTANFNGADSFTYRAFDGTTTGNVATVSIGVTPVNDAPVAVNDGYTVAEDGTLNVPAAGVLTNDTDVENSPLTATLVDNPTHGSLTLNANGSFTYTPTANYNGTDNFTYRADDGTTTGNLATVTITVTAINDAPAATNDSYTVAEDGALSVTSPGVLTNDTDVDGNPLTAVLVTGPSHGGLTLNSDGSFTYTPTANYNGADSFTYRASDGTASSNLATVSINVTAVNDAPLANGDTVSTPEDTPKVIPTADLTSNDSDIDGGPLVVTAVNGATNGTAVLNGDNTITFTPTANFNGTAGFNYTVSDGAGGTALGHVTVTVTAVNDAPVAVNDSYTLPASGTLTVPAAGVLTNDSDVEGSSLTAVFVTNPSHGTLSLNGDGSFTYTPTSAYNGSDSFTYRVSDGTTTGNIATVTITDNIAPTAVGVQTTNASGGTIGRMEQGDTIVYTFSEPIDPNSIITNWNGSTTNVVVRAYDGDILLGLLGGNDSVQVFDATNSDVLPLGTVNLGDDSYVTGLLGGHIRFGATGTPSTMTLSADKKTVTVVLGTYSRTSILGAAVGTENDAATMVWTPMVGPKDLAGNAIATTTASESGGSDREF